MDWNQLVEVMEGLELHEQVRFAKLKGIGVPAEIEQEAERQARKTEVAAKLGKVLKPVGQMYTLVGGSDSFPDRNYVKSQGLPIGLNDQGKVSFAKGIYLETRALEQVRDIVAAAIAECEAKGLPTSPA